VAGEAAAAALEDGLLGVPGAGWSGEVICVNAGDKIVVVGAAA